MTMPPRLIAAVLALAGCCLNACSTVSTSEVNFERHPIGLRVLNKVIDEYEGTTEYSLLFRNNGRDIVSFDYTVSDRPAVPHVDKNGPNSGLVENLYPGAEIEVPNPVGRMAVHVTLGTVTYGKKQKDELIAIYAPDKMATLRGGAPPSGPGDDIFGGFSEGGGDGAYAEDTGGGEL